MEMSGSQAGFIEFVPGPSIALRYKASLTRTGCPPDPEVGHETFIFMFVACVPGLEFAAKGERRGSHAPGRNVAQLYAR